MKEANQWSSKLGFILAAKQDQLSGLVRYGNSHMLPEPAEEAHFYLFLFYLRF
nr:hypothetical protein P5630_17310 [Bacillus subtilis]